MMGSGEVGAVSSPSIVGEEHRLEPVRPTFPSGCMSSYDVRYDLRLSRPARDISVSCNLCLLLLEPTSRRDASRVASSTPDRQ